MFIQSVFNNPLSVTNDNNKIQDAKGTSNKSAEIKQTVKNESKNIGSGSDTVLSNVVIDNHAATIQANSDFNWDTVTDDSNSFFHRSNRIRENIRDGNRYFGKVIFRENIEEGR